MSLEHSQGAPKGQKSDRLKSFKASDVIGHLMSFKGLRNVRTS